MVKLNWEDRLTRGKKRKDQKIWWTKQVFLYFMSDISDWLKYRGNRREVTSIFFKSPDEGSSRPQNVVLERLCDERYSFSIREILIRREIWKYKTMGLTLIGYYGPLVEQPVQPRRWFDFISNSKPWQVTFGLSPYVSAAGIVYQQPIPKNEQVSKMMCNLRMKNIPNISLSSCMHIAREMICFSQG